jgi:hypothetical protein
MRGASASRLLALLAASTAARPSLALAQGCAMCGSALADDPVGRAISWSIIFLMAAPYVIVGAIGSWLYLTYRRAGRRRAAAVGLTGLHTAPAARGRGGDVA